MSLPKIPTHYFKKSKIRFSKIRLSFNVDKRQLIVSICDLLSYSTKDEKQITKSEIEEKIKLDFYHRGLGFFDFYEETNEEAWELYREDAERLAKHLYPEYFKKAEQ